MGAATVQPRVRLAPTATRYKNEEMLSGVIRWLCSCAAASCADAYEPFRRFSWLLRLRCNHPRSQPWNPSGRTSRRQPKKTRGEERETATPDTVDHQNRLQGCKNSPTPCGHRLMIEVAERKAKHRISEEFEKGNAGALENPKRRKSAADVRLRSPQRSPPRKPAFEVQTKQEDL